MHRICAAWDYGVHPDPETFTLFARWKEVFDRFPVLTSPAYHAFRALVSLGSHGVPYKRKSSHAPLPDS